MKKPAIRAVLCLLAAGGLSACDRGDKRASAPNPDKCVDGQAIHVGDTNIQIKLTGTDYRWNTSGSFLTLTQQGDGKAIELVVSTAPGGPSLPKGDCLRSGGYIRLARAGDSGANRYLQALRRSSNPNDGADSDRVVIGAFPDPMINPIFNVVKVPDVKTNSKGAIIRQGDVIRIRGVTQDPWLVRPSTLAEGSTVGLIGDHYEQASNWTINRHGPPVGDD